MEAEYEKKYIATLGVELAPIKFKTNHGIIQLNIWDTAGAEKLSGLRDGYYIASDAAIIMFDLTSRISFNNLNKWLKDLNRVCGSIPIIIVGSKSDLVDIKVRGEQISAFLAKHNLHYTQISSKALFNIQTPFIYLLKQLSGDDNIQIEMPHI